MTRLSLIGLLVAAGVLTLIGARNGLASMRKWLKRAVRPAGLVLVVGVASLCVFRLLAADTFSALIGSLNEKVSDTDMRQRLIFIVSALSYEVWRDLHMLATSGRMAIAFALAAATGLLVGVARARSAPITMHSTSPVKLGILGFCAILALCLVVDSGLILRRRDKLRKRIIREYPDSFWGRMVQGELRQHERVGEPFELEFTDAISGRRVSMKDLRGQVVVVDFWATWCGPCVAEIPEMLRIYAEYHDQGVEFIGVSHDVPEADGGLEALKKLREGTADPLAAILRGTRQQGRRDGNTDQRLLGILGDQRNPHGLPHRRPGQTLFDRGARQARHADPATFEKGRECILSPVRRNAQFSARVLLALRCDDNVIEWECQSDDTRKRCVFCARAIIASRQRTMQGKA